MAAPASQRTVVLRRLGVLKDDASFDTPDLLGRYERSRPEDPLDAFANETSPAAAVETASPAAVVRASSSHSGAALNAIPEWAAPVVHVARRDPLPIVIAAAVLCLAGGFWVLNQLISSPGVETPTSSPEVAAESLSSSNTSAAAISNRSSRPVTSNQSSPRDREQLQAVVPGTSGTAVVGQEFVAPLAESASADSTDNAPQAEPLATATASDAAASSGDVVGEVKDRTIYSASDRDVQPPRILFNNLPGPAISAWTTRKNEMELIVSDSGAVERVRLMTPPQRMPDTFELTVAKLWKFAPAMKDGRPVRYRLVLTWEVNP